MGDYIVITLQGAMQSWGGHTFEDYRPSHVFPTRSAIIGLLGACIGIDRNDTDNRESLNASVATLTVRANPRYIDQGNRSVEMRKITDFHTVQNARKVDGAARSDAVVSRREYLCDAEFSVAMLIDEKKGYSLDDIKQAIRKPYYTPCLGRKACPLQSPLFAATITAKDGRAALASIAPNQGTLYSEEGIQGSASITVRDVPVSSVCRQFVTRTVNILGDKHVP